MSTLWRKAARDLGGERVRSVSIVAALALGIAGFLAVLSAYPILTRALNDGYRASNPPSATLAVDRLDDDIVQAVGAMTDVQGAEARRTVRGRIRTGPAEWRNLILFARRDYAASRVGIVRPESGAWPPGAGDMAVERDAFQVARARIGDIVTVRTQAGGDRSLRVSGSVHDVGQAQARMENMVYGYVTLDTLVMLGEEAYYDELAIRVAERPLDEAHIRDVAGAVAAKIEAGGRRVVRIDVPEPGQHPHAKLMGTLTLSIAIFGVFILALSGLIVFNVLTALLAGQVRQIGVMKAVGGTRRRIAGVYLLEAGLLGAAACAVALPVGLVGGRWLCRWMAALLNFDIASFRLPLWVYALVVLVGLAVPVIAAVVPVWRGTRVSVREALAPNGRAGRVFGAWAVDRALGRVVGPSRVLLLAIRNSLRSPLRVALTLVLLATGGVFFMSALNVRLTMVTTVDRFFSSSREDLSVSLAADYPPSVLERAARGIGGVSAAEAWVVTRGALPADGALATAQDEITVIGLPAETKLLAFDLSKGHGLDSDAHSVVVNTALFDRLGRPPMGTQVRLLVEGADAPLRVVGVARDVFSPSAAYVSLAFFVDQPRAGTANSLRVALSGASDASLDAAKTGLEESLERAGIRAAQASTKAERRVVLDEHFRMIFVFLLAVSCILGCIGALGLVTAVSLNVTERRREMGVLRAIGATPARVAKIVVIEGVTVGAMAWLAATAVVAPLCRAIVGTMLRLLLRIRTEVVVAVEPTGVAIWLALALVGSGLASLLPARQASRASVREALTYE